LRCRWEGRRRVVCWGGGGEGQALPLEGCERT
jgi:hypothetical protein